MIFFESRLFVSNVDFILKLVCVFIFESSGFFRLGVRFEWFKYFCVLVDFFFFVKFFRYISVYFIRKEFLCVYFLGNF